MLFFLFKFNTGALSYALRSSGFFCALIGASPVTSTIHIVETALEVISLWPMCHKNKCKKLHLLFDKPNKK